ncbi:MAG: hypothetical protein DUD32_08955 [Lactobacillus sp.]|nr:MAG: hypothetical protein DUD32_08955 [Lactobacillus sp.]
MSTEYDILNFVKNLKSDGYKMSEKNIEELNELSKNLEYMFNSHLYNVLNAVYTPGEELDYIDPFEELTHDIYMEMLKVRFLVHQIKGEDDYLWNM